VAGLEAILGPERASQFTDLAEPALMGSTDSFGAATGTLEIKALSFPNGSSGYQIVSTAQMPEGGSFKTATRVSMAGFVAQYGPVAAAVQSNLPALVAQPASAAGRRWRFQIPAIPRLSLPDARLSRAEPASSLRYTTSDPVCQKRFLPPGSLQRGSAAGLCGGAQTKRRGRSATQTTG